MNNGKRRWLCGLLALLTVMMVALPHHHHGHRFCAVVEVCAQDHAANDRHTAHHDSGGDRHACQLQPLAVEKAPTPHASFDVFPLALLGEGVSLAAPIVCAARRYNIYNVRARAICSLAVKSLRAPPFAFLP